MQFKKSMFYILCVVAIVCILLLIRFIYYDRTTDEGIAIRINDYTLTPSEFNDLFMEAGIYEDAPDSRKAFLKNLIKRKLLLQEGQRDGIDKQRDFLKSIENYWEEALLETVLDRKTKEVSSKTMVSDEELEAFYTKWSKDNPGNKETLEDIQELIKWQLLRKKQRAAIDTWINRLKSNAEIQIDNEAIGIK